MKEKVGQSELVISTAKRTFVAFCFGLILSIIFAFASAIKFGPLVKLERESADLGLRLASAIFDQSLGSTELPVGTSQIFLIDIDAEACRALASSTRCDFDRIMQPEVLDAVVEVVEQSNPKVAIIDGLIVPELAGDIQEKLGRLETPVLAPMELLEFETGNDGALRHGFVLSKSICKDTSCGNLSYHPSWVRTESGKSRYFSRELEVDVVADLEVSKTTATSFESLPFRAAKLARSEQPLHNLQNADEIGYTFPSFVFQAGGEPIDQERYSNLFNKFRGNVEHLKLSSAMPEKGVIDFTPPPPGSIVIIGSTAASGQDIHNTPLGPMGGMEVLANAIRSFQLAAPEQSVSHLEAFLIKISAVLKALIVIALTEFALAYLSVSRARAAADGAQTVEGGRLFDKWSVWIFLAMVFAFSAELLIACWEIVDQMSGLVTSAQSVDVLWPILGVTASALIGFSSEVQSKLEWIAGRIVDLIARRVSPDSSNEAQDG
ncbi:MAG: CHASE2 domain-containing protein [Erythrobacter sp.]